MFYHNKTEQVARHWNLICYQKPGLKLVLNHNKSRALHTRLLIHKPSDGFGMGFGWATDVVLAAQTRERSTIGPNCPTIIFPRLLGKNNNWNFNNQHVPESKCVAHISDAVIRSKLHIFTFAQGLATSKYCKHSISNIECFMLPKGVFQLKKK